MMNEWRQFEDPAFDLVFDYPEETAQGNPVERAERRDDKMLRVHFTSRDSQALYFEVTKYPDLPPLEEYRRHRKDLQKRFDDLRITDIQDIDWKSLPAYEYAFEWPEGRRSVLLFERNRVTYRILYDPRSLLNLQVLDTLRWID